MTNEIRAKAIKLAASYYANWKACDAALEDGSGYHYKYDGALRMAILLLGVEDEGAFEEEVKATAYRLWGDEIGKIYEANNATW